MMHEDEEKRKKKGFQVSSSVPFFFLIFLYVFLYARLFLPSTTLER